MAHYSILVLSTLETKGPATAYLMRRLTAHGVTARVIDTSLASGGSAFTGAEKLAAMQRAIDTATQAVTREMGKGLSVVLGLGGGTGGEIALGVMRALPTTFPKVLLSPLPFDPRAAVADSSIILVPSVVDICGLNATLRAVLENAAALSAGLCLARHRRRAHRPSIGITALGATEAAVRPLVSALKAGRQESTVFHANGYGGTAFARFGAAGAFRAIVDLTPHELTRIHIAGGHHPIPERFATALDVPRVVLPGGLNFLGLGEKSRVPAEYLKRPHYAHSRLFTHVKLTAEEMRIVAAALAEALNACSGPTTLIVPMGGFSHQDCQGGEIEDPHLRDVFLETVQQRLRSDIGLVVRKRHIASPQITHSILHALDRHLPKDGGPPHT